MFVDSFFITFILAEKIVDAILSKAQITEKKVSVQELYTFDEDKKSA